MSQLDRGQETRIMYIELETGYSDNGPASIGRVSFSKAKKTIYYRGKKLQRMTGGVSSEGTTSTSKLRRSSGCRASRRIARTSAGPDLALSTSMMMCARSSFLS